MSTISLRVPDNELDIFKSYAKHNNCSLSEIIRSTMLKHIEDEYDLDVFAQYEEEMRMGKEETRPIGDLWAELGL